MNLLQTKTFLATHWRWLSFLEYSNIAFYMPIISHSITDLVYDIQYSNIYCYRFLNYKANLTFIKFINFKNFKHIAIFKYILYSHYKLCCFEKYISD